MMRGLWSLLLIGVLVGVSHAATVGQDDFTVGVNTLLESHTPTCGGGSCGAAWTPETTNVIQVHATSDWAHGITDSNVIRLARKGDDLGSDQHDVTALVRLTNDGANRRAGPCGRMTTADFNHAICATLKADGTGTGTASLLLEKKVAGTWSTISTWANQLVPTTQYTIRLEIRNGTQKVFVDNVERISATEPNTTLQGNTYAGFVLNSGNTANTSVDNFVSATVEAPATSRALVIE